MTRKEDNLNIEPKKLCANCNQEIYQEWSRYNGRYFHEKTNSSGCKDLNDEFIYGLEATLKKE